MTSDVKRYEDECNGVDDDRAEHQKQSTLVEVVLHVDPSQGLDLRLSYLISRLPIIRIE